MVTGRDKQRCTCWVHVPAQHKQHAVRLTLALPAAHIATAVFQSDPSRVQSGQELLHKVRANERHEYAFFPWLFGHCGSSSNLCHAPNSDIRQRSLRRGRNAATRQKPCAFCFKSWVDTAVLAVHIVEA